MSQELGITADKQKNPSEWYTQVVTKADLADYAPVKGCMVIKPYGMKLWESIKEQFDTKIKETGVDNAYFPLFIPKRLLDKEEEILEGFDLEVAWIEEDEGKDMEEKLAVRPTSESIITEFMSKWVRSHRDLPLRLNQWGNVVRWEISDTKPFLRTREFLWQEGHTAHETYDGAEEEVMLRLEQYRQVIEEHLAIPSILGYKPEHDKFPGAKYTTTIETLMPDGKSIQSGTSHHLGQHFADAFDVTYEDEDAEKKTAHTTSWGLSTRTIGALVMAHGDNDGLKLPPSIAPTQVVIVPIYQEDNQEEVLEYCEKIEDKIDARVKMDDRDHRTPGYKFNEWELKGVPLRLEVGPNEMESGTVTAARRDTGEQENFEIGDTSEKVSGLLDSVQESMYTELEDYQEENIRDAESKEEILGTIGKSRGYVRTRWCGREECEEEIKEQVSAEIVVLPFNEDSKPAEIRHKKDDIDGECAVCERDAKTIAYFAKNY
ncbi:MAG: proline--tRNA ligase [Candidatus Nanohaloarchaea archaeon]